VSKKQKKSSSKPKESREVTTKPTADPSLIPAAESVSIPTPAPTEEKKPRMLRAVIVTPEILEAAKAYKKASGKSFYALGFEAISERLAKEGYLK
jgi:hypothetical protein